MRYTGSIYGRSLTFFRKIKDQFQYPLAAEKKRMMRKKKKTLAIVIAETCRNTMSKINTIRMSILKSR